MTPNIIATTWWSPIITAKMGSLMLAGGSTLCIGAVAVKTHKGWKAYIGNGLGEDENVDAIRIANQGAKLTREQAAGIFPQLNIKEFKY